LISIRSAALAGLGLLAVASLAACQSTQDKAAEARAEGERLLAAQKPLEIPNPNKEVAVKSVAVLHDVNGGAVAVELQNNSKDTLVGVPILADVRDAKGKRVFINNAYGSDFALNHVPLMRPGETVTWVNDQILAAGTPATAKVTVGQPDSKNPAQIPEIAVSPPSLEHDSSGPVARGTMTNQSNLDQNRLVLFAVARQGGKIIAAGRGGYKNLRANAPKPGNYNIFFIGDPAGGDIEVTAPPSVLQAP
jgi:hypothetical protein